VLEILPPVPLTTVAGLPPWLSGLVTLRDGVLPAVDLAARFGVSSPPPRLSPKLMICRWGPHRLACRVDGVVEVARVARDELRPAPSATQGGGPPLVLGAFGPPERLTLLFNLQAVAWVGEGGPRR
jgi:purine-binding chemotaxis protein CheW